MTDATHTEGERMSGQLTPEHRKQVVMGLVAEHWDLYVHNAWFKAAVEATVRGLPFLIEGLALQAERENEKQARALAAITRGLL